MAKSLINKSRGVGQKKRGRPPKPPVSETESAPSLTPTSSSSAPQDSPSSSKASTVVERASDPKSYTGLSQIDHGLTFPVFEPNNYFASDLFSNSSSLQETSKEDADKSVESIEKKRQTLRIVAANIGLNQDVVRTANDYRKLEGLVLDFAITGVNNETKYINFQTAGVNKDIAVNKFDQANERLLQGQKTLTGMRRITDLIDLEWDERLSLKNSQISSLRIAATEAKQALEPKLTQLSESFRQDLDDLN
ncbi:MAG TPA: hypothetical protein V6D14_17535 [Coleofasciculaceae cyanobacterium]|jgi:hypothetical protein